MKRVISLVVAICLVVAVLPRLTFHANASHAGYAAVVEDCMKACGYTDLHDAYKEACRGLLYDIESDGQEELVLQYWDKYSWAYEIWTIRDGAAICLLNTNVYSTAGAAKVSIATYDGDKYIVIDSISAGSGGDAEEWVFYSVNSNAYQRTYSLMAATNWDEGSNAVSYSINEEAVSKSEFDGIHKCLDNETVLAISLSGIQLDDLLEKISSESADSTTDIWHSFLATRSFWELLPDSAESYHSESNLEFAIFDINTDGTAELILQDISDAPFYYTWLFVLEYGEVVLASDDYGYGMYTFSPQYNMVIGSPEWKPFSGTGYYPFYSLTGSEFKYEFQVGQDAGSSYFSDADGNVKNISDEERTAYFSDKVWFTFTELNTIPKEQDSIDMTGWKKAYYDYIVQDKNNASDKADWDWVTYELIYLDGDAIPELWIQYQYDASGCRLVTCSDGAVASTLLDSGYLSYAEYENKFVHSFGRQGAYGDVVYELSDGSLFMLAEGSYEIYTPEYTWNGAAVAEEIYFESLNAFVAPASAKQTGSGDSVIYSYDEILEHLFPRKEFNEYIYRADYLLDSNTSEDLDYFIEYVNNNLPSRIFLESGEMESMNDLWMSVTNSIDSVVDGSAPKIVFKQQDVYISIIMNALGDTVEGGLLDATLKSSYSDAKKLITQLNTIMKQKYDLDLASDDFYREMTPEVKKILKEEIEVKIENGTVSGPINSLSEALKYTDIFFESADCFESFINTIFTYSSLHAVSESMADVLDMMYEKAPNDLNHQYMRSALQTCSRLVAASSEEVLKESLLTGIWNSAGQYGVQKAATLFWNKMKEKVIAAEPGVGFVLAAYKVSRTVTSFYYNTDAISEQTYKLSALRQYNLVLNDAILALVFQYNNDSSAENAEVLLSAITLLYSLAYDDCDVACAYVDAVDDAVVTNILQALSNVLPFIEKKDYSDVKEYIHGTSGYLKDRYEAFDTNWIYQLKEDYPSEFYNYCDLIGYEKPLIVPLTSSYEVDCPANVYVYDNEGALVAYLRDGKTYASGNITVVHNGDRKTIDFYGSEQYRIVYESYDDGMMDIGITEYKDETQTRYVAFQDVIVTNGAQYVLDVLNNNTTYTIRANDGTTITADYDSADSGDSILYHVAIEGGFAETEEGPVFELYAYAGEKIRICANPLDSYGFVQWETNVEADILDDTNKLITDFCVPKQNIIIKAVFKDPTYRSLGDANNDGTVDNVDAMLILQYYVGLIDEPQIGLSACDVDGSGEIDNVDAMMVLQYYVGLITEFPAAEEPAELAPIIAVDTGWTQVAALRADGTVSVAVEKRDDVHQGDTADWTDIISVCAGYYHTVGLKSDGSVVAVGANGAGQCNVSSWTDIVAITAGDNFTVGLRADGTVVATGDNQWGQCEVSDLTDIIAISASSYSAEFLKADGTWIRRGYESWEVKIPGVASIRSMCNNYSFGLKTDGTVVGVQGYESGDGTQSIPNVITFPWENIADIDGESTHVILVRSDGTVVADYEHNSYTYEDEVYNRNGECNVDDWTDIVSISAAHGHTVGLRSDGTITATGIYSNSKEVCDVSALNENTKHMTDNSSSPEKVVRDIEWYKINSACTYNSSRNLTGFLLQAMFRCSPENYDGFTVSNSFGAEQGHKPFYVDGAGYEYEYFSFCIPNDPSLEGWHTLTLYFDGTSESVEVYLKYLGDYSELIGTPNSVTGLGWEVSEWRVVEQ